MRHTELLTNAEYVPRVRDLESQGAVYWTIKVHKENLGYAIIYDLPEIERKTHPESQTQGLLEYTKSAS